MSWFQVRSITLSTPPHADVTTRTGWGELTHTVSHGIRGDGIRLHSKPSSIRTPSSSNRHPFPSPSPWAAHVMIALTRVLALTHRRDDMELTPTGMLPVSAFVLKSTKLSDTHPSPHNNATHFVQVRKHSRHLVHNVTDLETNDFHGISRRGCWCLRPQSLQLHVRQ